MLLHDLISRLGSEQLKGFGRLLVKQTVDRLQAAKAVGVEAPALILLDHEFAVFAYFLATSHGAYTFAITTEGVVDGPAIDPVGYAAHIVQLGVLQFNGASVVSEGRAMALMRDMAEARAAAATN